MKISDGFSLVGRRALVTGSSRGIGRNIALVLAQAGADVVVNSLDDDNNATATAEEIHALGRRAVHVQADLSNTAEVHRLFRESVAELGAPPNILVCNASAQLAESWLDVTAKQFDQQFSVNVRSTLELCQLAAPSMIEKKWGRILTIGSVQQVRPHPQMIAYAATKCAQASLALNLAKQLGPHGITANNLAPGVILTGRNTTRLADSDYAEKICAGIAVGYFGECDDCAGAALLLCSEAGRYITGQTLYVDGGMSLP